MFPPGFSVWQKGLEFRETQLAANNSTSLGPSSGLIAQAKPSGKIYWAMGSQEYFANGDPGHLPCAPVRGGPILESWRLPGSVCRSFPFHSLGGRGPSVPGLLNSSAEALMGRRAGGCLSREGGSDLPTPLTAGSNLRPLLSHSLSSRCPP